MFQIHFLLTVSKQECSANRNVLCRWRRDFVRNTSNHQTSRPMVCVFVEAEMLVKILTAKILMAKMSWARERRSVEFGRRLPSIRFV